MIENQIRRYLVRNLRVEVTQQRGEIEVALTLAGIRIASDSVTVRGGGRRATVQ